MNADLIPLALGAGLVALVAAASRAQGRREPTPAGRLSAGQEADVVLTLAAWGAFGAVLLLSLWQQPRHLVLLGLVPAILVSVLLSERRLDRMGSLALVELKVAAALGLAACGAALWSVG